MNIKKVTPLAIAILFGALTLLGLLFDLATLNKITLGWASLLAAFTLLYGILNLLYVHINRTLTKRNIYSGILAISLLSVLGLAYTDSVGLTNQAVNTVFRNIQFPLETALASLLAFFLFFAGFQLMKRQRSIWSFIFMLTAVTMLFVNALLATDLLPENILSILERIQYAIQNVIVLSGVRGLLLGVALGTILLSIRILLGVERPYNK
jgi:hypothetical protein